MEWYYLLELNLRRNKIYHYLQQIINNYNNERGIKMNELSKREKEEIKMIYELYHKTKLSVLNIHELFTNYSYGMITAIGMKKMYTEITKSINTHTTFEYIKNMKGMVLKLNETYIKYIYIFSNCTGISCRLLSRIFNVSYSTIIKIKLSKLHNDVTDNVNLKRYKYLYDKVVRKPSHYLSDTDKEELLMMVDSIKDGTLTINDLCKMYDVNYTTIHEFFKGHNVSDISKYDSTKLSEKKIIRIFDHCQIYTIKYVARLFGVNEKTVSKIKNAKTHKDILIKYRIDKLSELHLLN